MVHANAIPMLTVPTLPGMIHPTIFAQAPFGSCPVWFVPQLVRAPLCSRQWVRRICGRDPKRLLSER